MPARKTMLVNALDPEEVRVAILLDGELDELYVETRTGGPSVGNIYKGRVENFERNLEAAFVDIGTGKHGFLHGSDVSLDGEPRGRGAGSRRAASEGDETEPDKTSASTRTTRLRKLLKPGADVFVQVRKESTGSKGPALTTFIGMPGRYLVLMPSLGRIGVSRRIRDRETREALKRIMTEIEDARGEEAKGMGFVVRTEARTTSEKELRGDVDELLARWRSVRELEAASTAPALLWEEADLVARALRDYLASDTSAVWTDTPESFERASRFVEENLPALKKGCKLHEGPEPVFAHFGVEEQMEALADRRVALPSGGYLIIEQTEAMAVVDVNSGRTRHRKSPSAMILKTNLEAARAVTRQLRLRDIGGLVLVDFIDMEDLDDRRKVEDEVRKGLEPDKARTNVLPISDLGVLEMTRQRQRLALEARTSARCPLCSGRGHVRSVESLSVAFLRELRSRMPANDKTKAEAKATKKAAELKAVARFHPERALAVSNHVRAEVAALEAEGAVEVIFQGDPKIPYGRFEVDIETGAAPARAGRRSAPRPGRSVRPTPRPSVEAKDAPDVEAPAPDAEASPKKKRKRKKRRGKRGGARRKKKSALTSEDKSGK